MIPKLIHQTAKTADISPQWAPLQEKVRALHSDWTYRLWTDEANAELIQSEMPQLWPVYEGLPKPIMKADVARYVFMVVHGGLYLDTDYEFLKPFDLLDARLVLPRESNDGAPLFLGNCVFASIPGHPFWTAVLEDLIKSPPTKASLTKEDDIIHLTGPGLLTRVYHSQFASDDSIFVPPRSWFHPPTPQNQDEYRLIARDSQTYGIHFCFGTWRALTWKERLKNRLQRWFGR